MSLKEAAQAAVDARQAWMDCWCDVHADGSSLDCEHFLAFSKAMNALAEALNPQNN